VNRVSLSIGDRKGKRMSDNKKSLDDYVTEIPAEDGVVVIYFSDLGPQVGWRTVFLVEYGGPLLIMTILLAFRLTIWGGKAKPLALNQWVLVACAYFHYIKRELESLFVHRFSKDTMPIKNIFINCTHYWVFFGAAMTLILRPGYTPPAWLPAYGSYLFAGFFLFFAFMNGACHMVLRNLRAPGSTERGIPHGWGFGVISCANYFWESMTWLMFAIPSQQWCAYAFWFFSSAIMCVWAKAKHDRYKKDFPEYPTIRKAMIPFIF